MPIRLEAPTYRPGGPDGKGWNRLSLNAHMGIPADQCALKPRDYPHLWETTNRPRCAQWGNYGPCGRSDGDCTVCPVLTTAPRLLNAFGDSVLVRIRNAPILRDREVLGYRDEPWLMNRPEDGWASFGYPWTWAELARLPGWTVGRRHMDEHSDGFWLHKVNPARYDGLPDCTHGYLNRDHCRACRLDLNAQPL
jgi:hypothetical protein